MANRNLIFCAYAYEKNLKSSLNISCQDKTTVYFKNTIVALVSAKTYNNDCDVALVTNIDVPAEYRKTLEKHDIMIFKKSFDKFNFGKDYMWGLAFYKLCALNKMLEEDYDNYLMIDTDTYTQSSLNDLWEETKHNIMIYYINQRLTNKNYIQFNKEIKELYGSEKIFNKYGGEFIAGNRHLLSEFMKECESVFIEMKNKMFQTQTGDEFITNVVANKMKMHVKPANAYIFRFWTGSFRLVSTCYINDPVSIIHVPREKTYGMLKLYDIVKKTDKLPYNKKVHKILHLNKMCWKVKIAIFLGKIGLLK